MKKEDNEDVEGNREISEVHKNKVITGYLEEKIEEVKEKMEENIF
jgi:hypothetical protein